MMEEEIKYLFFFISTERKAITIVSYYHFVEFNASVSFQIAHCQKKIIVLIANQFFEKTGIDNPCYLNV